MKNVTLFFLFSLFTLLLLKDPFHVNFTKPKIAQAPNDWFHRQRAYPFNDINYSQYNSAVVASQSRRLLKSANTGNWIQCGPFNTGGRLTDVEGIPEDNKTIYAATAHGGVFKSEDGGDTWRPVFDQTNTMSIGDIAIDPKNCDVIYVGTGEVNGGGGSVTYGGNGVFKSTDSGETWKNIGLAETRFIGRIVVDPVNSDIIYAAATGKLFSKNSERGLYKSTNGGNSWERILYISDKTGCVDVIVNPSNPNIIIAAMWERIRNFDSYSYSGLTSGLYRSTDAGVTWTEIIQGLPSGNRGRIGLDLCKSSPHIIYAAYTNSFGGLEGIYKSTDTGISWTTTNTSSIQGIYSSYGWWFSNIRVDPDNADKVFILGLYLARTDNGGVSWTNCSGDMHVDHHGMYIHPNNTDLIFEGNDGGFYISTNGGTNWEIKNSFPVTQFYTCETDNSVPGRLYGGAQDNGVQRTLTGGLDDWTDILWGDGFHVLVDPNDNRYVYAESQYGALRRSTDGGATFVYALNGIESGMSNWNAPIIFDPSNSATLYFGTQKVYKSTNRGVSWNPISPNIPENLQNNAFHFGTITTIAVSKNGEYVYAGSDDGKLWSGRSDGTGWTDITNLIDINRWITRIAVDPQNPQSIYVTLSGFRNDNYQPHVLRITDGAMSEDISSNLPEAPVNDIIVDDIDPNRLFVATDVGVYTSSSRGNNWTYLGNTLPVVPINDICIHQGTRTLVAATYGRSMYKINLNTALAIDNSKLPLDYDLNQNYPNPFNPITIIKYKVAETQNFASQRVTIKVYDFLGREIATLVDGVKSPGMHSVQFNADNLPSGVYIYSLKTKDCFIARKMVLLK